MAQATTTAKPSVYKIIPFDESIGTTVNISWNGRQQKENILKIKQQGSEEDIYDEHYASFKGVHVIPPEAGLVNGRVYEARVAIIDMDDDQSLFSDPITFRCFTTPVFLFNGLSPSTDNEVTNSEIELNLAYSQAESELLNTWTASLYDIQKNLLDSKTNIRASTSMSYIFSGLANMTTYYVRATGETVNGLLVDTGYYKIVVAHDDPAAFFNLVIENAPDDGSIYITSNAITITGHSEHEVEYVEDVGGIPYAADLIDNSVVFEEGFELNEDFIIYIRAYHLALPVGNYGVEGNLPTIVPMKAFLILKNQGSGQKIELNYWKTTVIVEGEEIDQYQIYLHSYGFDYEYGLWSNALTDLSEGDMLGIKLTRVNGIYNLELIKYDEE